MSFHFVARLDDLSDRELLGVEIPTGDRVCVIRVGDEVYAVSDVCTHQAFPMSAGEVHGDGTIQCSWHGARFDCATGAVRHPPAEEALPVYEVEVRNGDIFVGARKP